jgi:hypothetical protein
MFTFGYWGWGSSTALLLKASAAVEASRGFEPPMFVDLRISRSVRATGFRDAAFEKLAGRYRYLWMPALGNRTARDRPKRGPRIVIDDPAAADVLLSLVAWRARHKQRVIAFCACEWPGTSARPLCHRRRVADLVLANARQRRMKLGVVEWPGGRALARNAHVTPKELGALERGASFRPRWPATVIAGLPWGSRISARTDAASHTFLAQAAKPFRGKLVVPQHAWNYEDWDDAYEECIESLGLDG